MTLEEVITIRSFDELRDRVAVEDFERRCQVGPGERVSLLTDTMGDPICRIRNSPIYNMLVAETEGQLVGVIRGTVKVVTLQNPPTNLAKVGYILGLRVSTSHRRQGIATKLAQQLEQWFVSHAVDYAYMATDQHNTASIGLFINKLGFHEFRTPSILVNPVTQNWPRLKIPSGIEIKRLNMEDAEFLYRSHLGSAEFFPQDIDAVLKNRLSLGTWIAYPSAEKWDSYSSSNNNNNNESGKYWKNWAMVSVWNSAEIFKLRLGKAPSYWRVYAKGTRWVDRALRCLGGGNIPVVPDFLKPFGFYFVYGVYKEGPLGGKLVRSLCDFVKNMGGERPKDCKVIVTEIGGSDGALRTHIPHSKLLSCPDDLWCIKPLLSKKNDGCSYGMNGTDLLYELIKTAPSRPLFVDPREV